MKEVLILKEEVGIIQEARDIFKKIKKINIDYTKENFIIIYLNIKNKVLSNEVLFMGGINACLICPNTLFKNALLNNSSKVIIAHNHPSDSLNPSKEDIDIFKRLKDAGDIINIEVLDSIIFNKKQFYALKDMKGGIK